MAQLSKLTDEQAVTGAIAEFERLGRDAFLGGYGFGKARSYFLRYEGERYDSKAITGVAYGLQFPDEGPLTADDFSGGEQTSVAVLQRLGFESVSGPSPADRHRKGHCYPRELGG